MNILFINSLHERLCDDGALYASQSTQLLWLKRLRKNFTKVISLSVNKLPLAIFMLPFIIFFCRIKKIYVYNLMRRAPLGNVIKIAHFFKVPVCAIVFDISNECQLRMARYLKDADERIVITDAIANDFAPGLPYSREDGAGLRKHHTPTPVISTSHESFRIVYAGAIASYNCIELILDCMASIDDMNVQLVLAGKCADGYESIIANAAKKDSRIVYLGVIPPNDLKSIYDKASVLLCLRDIQNPLMKYHFPSKIFELIDMRKPVIASNIAHLKQSYGQMVYVLEENTVEALKRALEVFRNF